MTSALDASAGDPNRLYSLLPALYRLRDDRPGTPLHALLEVLDADRSRLLRETGRLYDDAFIETCAASSIASIARLVGYDTDLLTGTPELDRALVADALTVNARKGTIASLALIAGDVGQWTTRVTEASTRLAMTASARFTGLTGHPLPDIRRAQAQTSVSVREANRLTDVRDVDSTRTRGRGKPTSVLVDVWRQRCDTVVRGPALRVGPRRYTFDALGDDVHLAVRPARKRGCTRTVGDVDVPALIERSALAHHLADYVGPERSIMVWVDGGPLDIDEVLVGDLTSWHQPARRGRARYVCVDPTLGRLLVGPAHGPRRVREDATVEVTYSRLSAGGPGASHAEVRPSPVDALHVRAGGADPDSPAPTYRSIAAAYDAWVTAREEGTAPAALTIEVDDDAVYREPLQLRLHAGESVHIMAGSHVAPAVAPAWEEPRTEIRVHGVGTPRRRGGETALEKGTGTDAGTDAEPASFAITGLTVWHATLRLTGQVGSAVVDQCTLAPFHDRRERARAVPAVHVVAEACDLAMHRSISGPLRFGVGDEHDPDSGSPVRLAAYDCILDAGGDDAAEVLRGWRRRPANVEARLERCTVLGSLALRAVDLVRDSLVTGRLDSSERQRGTVAHTYLGRASRTPRRDHCQPDLAIARGAVARRPVTADAVVARLQPELDSRVCGDATYGRLGLGAPVELRTGAHDGGELGAFHDLWEAARAAALTSHLAALAPAGVDVGVRFKT